MLKNNELPVDADGMVFMPGDTVWEGEEEGAVQAVTLKRSGWYVLVKWVKNGFCTSVAPKSLTHENPDFWDAIEREVYHLVMSEYLDDPEGDVKRVVEQIKETVGA